MTRNKYIDLIKGIASISVIFIHTVFESGVSYVPDFLRGVSLLVDVPIFFLLSGLTSSLNIKKNIKRLLKLQLSYMLFISIIFIIQTVYFKEFKINTLLSWFIHTYSKSTPLGVVMGSMWYLKVYFLVIIIGLLLLKYIPPKFYLFFTIILLFGICFFSKYYRFGAGTLVYIVFYIFIFLVGYQCKNIKIKKLYLIIVFSIIVTTLLILHSLGINIILGNSQKFSPNIIYLLYSSISLILILFFKDRISIVKNNFITYIGQNAIFYYFSQGVSSSLIYILVGYFREILSWYELLIIAFFVNFLLAIILAEGIKKLDKLFWKLLYKIESIVFSK